MLEGECGLKKDSENMCIFTYLSICKYRKRCILTEQLDCTEQSCIEKCIAFSVGVEQGRILHRGRKAMYLLFVYDVPPMVLHVPENYSLNSNLLHLPYLALTLFSL